MEPGLVEVGQVRKTHGYAGELKLRVESGFEDDVAGADFLFVGATPDSAIPYEVKKLRGADWIVTLDGVDSRESAAVLRGRPLYLKSKNVSDPQPQRTSANAYIDEQYKRFVGFAMIDTVKGELGAIEAVEAYPQQSMASVVNKNKSHLVPLNQDLIRGIDFTKRIVFVELPEGLLDL